jgi:hypothetical protein
MSVFPPTTHLVLAESFMPLQYEIACIVLTALFFFAFSVAREPRGWRRLFQSMFSTSANFSVNKNKVIDESLKRYGIVIAMAILMVDVGLFVWGVTYRSRKSMENMSQEDWLRYNEIQKIQGNNGAAGARKAVGE